MVNSDRVLASFLEMVRIYSPSFKEDSMATYCAERLQALGFSIYRDDAYESVGSDTGNLIAVLPGEAPGILAFCAHMDTVLPCEGICPEIVEASDPRCPADEPVICSSSDTILSADDRSGIAAIFEGIEAAHDTDVPLPTLVVLLTVCEEQSLLGASALKSDFVRGVLEECGCASEDAIPCFVLDADGRPGTIIMGAPYHYTLRASFTGRRAHAGVEPEAGVSAIQAAASAITQMPLGRIGDHTTANIGAISGGVAVNIVPSDCALQGECRSLYENEVLNQKEAMTHALEAGAHAHDAQVDIDWTLDYPGVLFKEDDEIVVRLSQAISVAGIEPQYIFSGGGADTNVLATKGFNAITLGTGMTNFHSCDEYIRVADLAHLARIVECLIFEYAT